MSLEVWTNPTSGCEEKREVQIGSNHGKEVNVDYMDQV